MAKAKSSRKHAELLTPTTTSRALTWLLLIVLPILGYLFGMQMQRVQDNVQISELRTSLDAQSNKVMVTVTPSPAY